LSGSGVYRLVSPRLELYSKFRAQADFEIVGVVRSGRGPDDPVSNRGQPDQARRTWFRLLFESQLAAYSPSAEGQANLGWYYWTCKSNLYDCFRLSHLGSSTSCPLSLSMRGMPIVL
jgi:hypothetical protein